MAAYCYLLINTEGLTYLGATENISKRLKQHNSLTPRKSYTSCKGPWSIKALQEFTNKDEAFNLEKVLKKNSNKKKLWIESFPYRELV